MEQYAKMMGGDLSTMRNAFRPGAEKQAKVNVTLAKIAEVEEITVTDEDVEAEYAALAAQYELEADTQHDCRRKSGRRNGCGSY